MDILHIKNKFRAPMSRDIKDVIYISLESVKKFISLHYFLHFHLLVTTNKKLNVEPKILHFLTEQNVLHLEIFQSRYH